ncbi:MarR family winged helix-turn-helix transcriptional regulator [Thalassobellus citreus]|uniref:MarR family winged helix-turn-helix transcriptional regulator n=1 Tax=Thalassobellus citreus TaxID=3367752 RepID=UPI0037A97CD5
MKNPSQTIFYLIERTIKEYRKFAQKQINDKHKNITIDQALVLFFIIEQPQLSQSEIGELIFKDNASISRMVELMIKNGYLLRETNNVDRRKINLTPTTKGVEIFSDLKKIIAKNREIALQDISEKEIFQLFQTLNKIFTNCQIKT